MCFPEHRLIRDEKHEDVDVLSYPSIFLGGDGCHGDLSGLRREPCGVWASRDASLGCQLSTAIECGTHAAVVTVPCYSEWWYCCTVNRQSVFLDVRPMVY